jgi:pyruvate dehydrogenase E1 component alpha subunit
VRAVYAGAKKLIESAREGGGPGFLVCNTYRYHGHHVGDINREYYRSKQEEHMWKTERDPVRSLAQSLISKGHTDADSLAKIDAELKAEMQKAVEFAIAAPYPSASEVAEDVYA